MSTQSLPFTSSAVQDKHFFGQLSIWPSYQLTGRKNNNAVGRKLSFIILYITYYFINTYKGLILVKKWPQVYIVTTNQFRINPPNSDKIFHM